MIKRRNTKHQLIFTPVDVMGQLRLRFKENNWKSISKIYMPRKQYLEYKKWILTNHPATYYSQKGRVYFKGARVLPL